jgi:hypothetical protein
MKNDKWRELVAECQSSGKSITVWCKEQGIACSTYYNWVRKLKGTESQQWVNVTTTTRETSSDEIKLRCDRWTIAVSQGFNVKLLAEILKVVDAVCC